ncbi:hypothetical protein [Azospirillum sp. B510]|uniref:hypothetical protein n=1 Tax=Azospirillum sp. (strain B510) TaxID=137722 RepID=UPI0002F6A5D3|nr:hypothetical protein [Azospirillum sp. B510]
MTTLDADSAVFAAKFAVIRIVVCFALFGAFSLLSMTNPNAILAADEATAAVAMEMVKSMPVTVADAAR